MSLQVLNSVDLKKMELKIINKNHTTPFQKSNGGLMNTKFIDKIIKNRKFINISELYILDLVYRNQDIDFCVRGDLK